MDYMDKLGQYYTLIALPTYIWQQLSDSEQEALSSAIGSFRKEIEEPPLGVKKVRMIQPGHHFNPIISVQFECPNCHRIVACQTNVIRCLNCGQLLDWSDINRDEIPCEDYYEHSRWN